MIDPTDVLSVRRQCELLSLSRGSFYYEPEGESEQNLAMMRLMDEHILEEPTAGVLTMQAMLKDRGYIGGYERIRRLMRKANIYPIYPRRHLSVLGEKKYVHPYLLRDMKIERPNQVWEIDITYVPMARGFLYLVAIIDVYSRYIVAWGLSNTLDAESSLAVVKEAIARHGKPEIFSTSPEFPSPPCKEAIARHGKPEILNSDQGSQFTCALYVEYLQDQKIRISMDGKGRALDNIYIERFWRTIKHQHIYLNPARDGRQLFQGIERWLALYHHRSHQGIGMTKPAERYNLAA